MNIPFITLEDGKVRVRYGNKRVSFRPTEPEKARAFFCKHDISGGILSSTCDFPEENGFDKDFDARGWLASLMVPKKLQDKKIATKRKMSVEIPEDWIGHEITLTIERD